MKKAWLQQSCNEVVGAYHVRYDLRLAEGWTVIYGPSGTGKSTWLRMLAGLIPQRSGSLLLHGEQVRRLPAYRRRLALVEQAPALFPHLDVERNLAFSPHAPRDRQITEALLKDFHLLHLRRAAVQTLSGGERQRVAIARALHSQPRALLLDEVFTGMDSALRADLIGVLQRYRERMNLPVLSVTHDIAEAFATAEEVLRMQDGSITAQGLPHDILAEERADLLTQLTLPPRAAD